MSVQPPEINPFLVSPEINPLLVSPPKKGAPIGWIIFGIIVLIAIIIIVIILIVRNTKKGCGSGPACSGTTPYCVTGLCQQCRTSADCPTPTGVGSSACVNGTCTLVTSCATNADCPTGQVCSTGICITAGNPCQTDIDCGLGGQVCRDGYCQFPTCVSTADCPLPGQICVNGQCGYGETAVTLATYIAELSTTPLPPDIDPMAVRTQAPSIASSVLSGCSTSYRNCANSVIQLCSASGIAQYCTSQCVGVPPLTSTNDTIYCTGACTPITPNGADAVFGFPCTLIRNTPPPTYPPYPYVY